MASREIYNDLLPQVAFNTQLINTDTTTNGVWIDTLGYGLGILFTGQMGVRTTGDITPLFEESDDGGSTSNVVADVNIVPVVVADVLYETGQEVASKLDGSNEIFSIGLIGTKRHVRLSGVSANTANLTFGAMVHKMGEIRSVYGLVK